MLITIYECLHYNFYPKYLKNYLTLRLQSTLCEDLIYFHCVNLLPLLMVFTLLSIKTWNSLPENIGTERTLVLERSLLCFS